MALMLIIYSVCAPSFQFANFVTLPIPSSVYILVYTFESVKCLFDFESALTKPHKFFYIYCSTTSVLFKCIYA